MMQEHASHLLGAYLDGELGESRRKQVEVHLADCRACRSELEDLRKLSMVLKLAPSHQPELQASVYAARISQRLPREIPQPGWQKVLRFGWQAAPALFVGLWAFVQAVLIVTAVFPSSLVPPEVELGLPNPGALISPLPWALDLLGLVFPDLTLEQLSLPDLFGVPVSIPQIPSFFQGILEAGTVSLVVSALTALLLASWLVGWIAYNRSRHSQLPVSEEL